VNLEPRSTFADRDIQESLGAAIALNSRFDRGWWLIYFFLSNSKDFEQNYLNAWSQMDENPSKLKIFVDNDTLEIDIHCTDKRDAEVFKQLKMFYRYLKVRRGFTEIIIPKKLVRIDCVQVIGDNDLASYLVPILTCQ
jgi:hypothetical protein